MECAVLGWLVDNPRLRLDYRRFSYAGKFVTGKYGIAVVRGELPEKFTDRPTVDSLPPLPDGLDESEFVDGILAAVAFNADRTDPDTLWLRYLTVRRDLRGSGLELGPQLAFFVTNRAVDRGYERIRIAVNNVFSYHALFKAGFSNTGRETGIAELILQRPAAEVADTAPASYQQGLDQFGDREGLSEAECAFLRDHADAEPPALVELSSTTAERVDSGVSNPPGSSE